MMITIKDLSGKDLSKNFTEFKLIEIKKIEIFS